MSKRARAKKNDDSLEARIEISLADAEAGWLTRHQNVQALMEHLEDERNAVGRAVGETASRQTETVRMAPLGELTAPKIDQGGPVGTDDFAYVDISSVDNKLKRITEPKALAAEAAPSRAKQRLKSGDVLVSMTRPNLNAVAIVPPELDGAVGSTGFYVLRANEGTEPRWLYYAVQTQDFVSAMSELVQGALYPAVRPKDIRAFEIPHRPLDQQKRIVAEIEKQFSRLDEAVANLKRVKTNLKRYKAAVLKAAVEGRLVETEAELVEAASRRLDQRQDAATTYETGEQLLQRILETRRSQWQGKGKYKEPAAPDTTDLPELPEGWVWATVDQLLMSLRNGLSKKPEDSEPGIPILRISSVRPLELDTKDSRFYRLQTNECVDDYKLEVGDVLFVRYNGTKELVGVCALVNVVTGALLYPDKLIRGRVVNEQQVSPSYLAIAANVGRSRQHIDELIKTTAGQQGIAGGEIKQMPLPLPPFAEQLHIVVEIDRRLSLIREIETQVDANFQRAERLRQSILAKAFSGLLLQQYGVKECAESAISG